MVLSHQAGPATSFHSSSRARFQFPNKVLQAAGVLITPGDAGGLLSSCIHPYSPSHPLCGCSSYTLGFREPSPPEPWSGSQPGSWAGMAFCSTPRQIFLEVLKRTLPCAAKANTSCFSNTTCQRRVLKLGETFLKCRKQGLLFICGGGGLFFFSLRNVLVVLAKIPAAACCSDQANLECGGAGVLQNWGGAAALPAGGPHQQPCAGVAALRALSAGRVFEPAPLPRHWPARARGGQPAVGAAGGAP